MQPAARAADAAAAGAEPVTLLVQAPDGHTLRLSYGRDQGWKLFGRTFGGKLAAATLPDSDARSPEPADEPLTVFIDGPSGYTYVWMADSGWQFIGHIADRRH